MLCVAKVHLSDWPLDDWRDVDPADETIRGLLRAGYIVPGVIPGARPAPPPQIAEPVAEADDSETPAKPKPRRASAKKE